MSSTNKCLIDISQTRYSKNESQMGDDLYDKGWKNYRTDVDDTASKNFLKKQSMSNFEERSNYGKYHRAKVAEIDIEWKRLLD
ncbi:17086_t:CDS:2 [Funneliformis caledonium]|uniref:17086_t:CDS:1 n=1 Tax=Funneliformis caledonium TaxID=1117310 RepID=A0A9N8ZTN0_9GLOM|nr:17086_t:CDS:2 [Funneliformis caledonium]